MIKIHTRSWWARILFVIATIISLIVSSIIILFFLFGSGQKKPHVFLSTNLMGLAIKEKNVDQFAFNQQFNEQTIDADNDVPNANELQNNFLLGKTGLDMIKTKIINRMGIGPEFFALKEIVFMEGSKNSLIDNTANGSYYPATQQIIINTSPWITYFQNDWQIRSDYYDDISELLFQVLYHEYGHHKANTYLLNQYSGTYSVLNSQNIYIQTNQQRTIEPWNKFFTENFMSNLTYDDSSVPLYSNDNIRSYYSGALLTTDITYQNQTKNSLPLQSIGSVYNAQTLFARANSQDQPQYPEVIAKFKNNIGLNFSPAFTYFQPLPVLGNISFKTITYLYSMQELFTRKYMQLTFPFKTTTLLNDKGLVQSSLHNSDSYFASTYLSDTLNYQLNFDSNSSLQYLSDAPFASTNTAQGLIDNFHNLNGQINNTNLSLIWSHNTSNYTINNSQVKVNFNDNAKSNEIKFGGFFDQTQINKNYQYIGYFDDTQNFHGIKISSFDYDYNQIAKLGGQNRLPLTKGSKKFYVTNDWVNGDIWNNKILYFAENGSGQTSMPLTSTLDSSIGLATTNRFYSPLGSNRSNPYYQVMTQNQKVMISQYQR